MMTELGKKHKSCFEQRRSKPQYIPATSYYLDAYIDNLGRSPILREARALLALWSHCRIDVYADELLPGQLRFYEPVAFHYGCGTYIDYGCIDVIKKERGMDEAESRRLDESIRAVHERRHVAFNDGWYETLGLKVFTPEMEQSMRVHAASTTFFGGHMVPDFETLLQQGLDGYRDEIRRAREASDGTKRDFYEAMDTILDAFAIVLTRTADAVNALQASGTEEQKRLSTLAENLRHIAACPPSNFHQALLLVYFAHMLAGADTFGRFDKYLYPFYEKDLRAGLLTSDFALSLLECLCVKVEQMDQIQNMTLGGVLEDGAPCYNALTRLMLQATRNAGYKGPNLCLRINDVMPTDMWEEIRASLATGQGLPALYNDGVMIPFLEKDGYPPQVARDFCLAGCSQVMLPGRTHFVNDIGIFNVAKVLELTLYGGVDAAMTGLEAGERGETEFDSFHALYRAFCERLEDFIRLEAEINNTEIRFIGSQEGYALRSLLTRDCIENGKGCYQGGARYNGVEMEFIGITNVADSLAAIKKLVYDERSLTLSQLREALLHNFDGYESLRAQLLHCPKFGNDDPYVDDIRADLTCRCYETMRAQKGAFGGHYIPGEVIFTAHDDMGSVTGATPDGRKKGEVLADSAGASQGLDRCGPTALLNSCLKLPSDSIVTTTVLNLKFLKSLFESEGDKCLSLIRTYFAQGGQQVQVNVCDSEVLKKAYERPQDYAGLIVRVGGFSAYFTALSQKLQLEIIARSEL